MCHPCFLAAECSSDPRFSFFSNLLAVVFILLNLNAIMSVIFNVPAAIFSTVSPPSILDAMYAHFASLQDRRLPCSASP